MSILRSYKRNMAKAAMRRRGMKKLFKNEFFAHNWREYVGEVKSMGKQGNKKKRGLFRFGKPQTANS